ncbi:MAG: HAMP domain-containing protein [Pirellulales bacterium]|nr:HAMP domain-containing protein [Pirellulales bacterium]
MLGKWPIRVKVLIGLGLLLLVVAILAGAGIFTGNAYRNLVRALRDRADEFPPAAELSRQVSQLRLTVSRLQGLRSFDYPTESRPGGSLLTMYRAEFHVGLDEVDSKLADYKAKLEEKLRSGSRMADNRAEWDTVRQIEASLARIHDADRDGQWMFDSQRIGGLAGELDNLQTLAADLPSHLHNKLRGLSAEVRGQYRALIVGSWIAGAAAALILALFVRLFYRWVLSPLGVLIEGSRRVASGRFDYRIRLETDDEMAELARAMNDMTARFRAIRDDLDNQVRERTRQVVRGEQLASVGLLAAGVAHEINNPLASIAMCAESLESRVDEILDPADARHNVVAHYLTMIQSEAFRCKDITEKLLDFSRTGPTQRQPIELGQLVQGVIEMIGHLGKYRDKTIQFAMDGPVVASVNAQEIKQVVLNLLTNALDSLEGDGAVRVRLASREGQAELVFDDDGCGMAPDVLEHVFEPFFTRRRSGQGTGLGLSITYRIVSEHGGEIHAESRGPGQGSTFRVRLPLGAMHKEVHHQHQAA